jgi:polar amino acid transport system substrate-binding protein
MDNKQTLLSIIINTRLTRSMLALLAIVLSQTVAAQDLMDIYVPLLWNPQHHVEKPNLSNLKAIRFITDDTYPPFGFTQSDGSLAGFNIDLARALCDELQVTCTIQARGWDNLIPALEQGQGDAIIASLALTPNLRKQVDVTAPYYKTPARFFTRTNSALNDIAPETIMGLAIGVERHSAHEAFLKTYFSQNPLRLFEDVASLRAALKRGDIDLAFGDGISTSLWLAGAQAHQCCRFASGPYLEPNYFSEGATIAVKKGNANLRRALDYALAHIASKVIYRELYLRYFPISFF